MSGAGFPALLAREMRNLAGGGSRPGAFLLPVLFFLCCGAIFPFAVGPDAQLLAKIGGGVIWVSALLAAILPIDRLVAPDAELGIFDQYHLRGISEEWVMLAKIMAHWLSFAPALLIATLLAAGLLGLSAEQLGLLLLSLLVGTPGLAALGVAIAALTCSLRGGAALGGMLFIPLAVPLLIFGAGSLQDHGSGGLALLGACSLLLTAITPFVGAAAIRALRG